MSFIMPKTEKGYGFFEASSTLQKAIRRGDENTAMFFAVELFNSGYDEYVWSRLKIIATEDIGLASNACVYVSSLYQSYSEQKKQNKEKRPERLFLAHAVLLLVRAPKSRYVDLATIYHWKTHEETKMAVPDYAHDMHTATGRKKGRGIDHFYDEGVKCENFTPVAGEVEFADVVREVVRKNPGKLSFKAKKSRSSQQTMDFETPE